MAWVKIRWRAAIRAISAKAEDNQGGTPLEGQRLVMKIYVNTLVIWAQLTGRGGLLFH